MTLCNAPTIKHDPASPTGESVTHCKLEFAHKGLHDDGCVLFKVSRRRGKDMLQPVLPTTTIPDVCWAIRWTTRLSSWFCAEVGTDGQASLLEGPFTFMLGLYWTKGAARKKMRELRSYVESADYRPTDRPTYRLVRFTWKPLPLKAAAPAAPAASPPPEATPETTPETTPEATSEATPEAAVPAASKDRVHAKLQEKVRAERDQARTECERLRGECTGLQKSLRLLRALHEERYAKIVELSDRCAAHEHVIGQVAARHGHEYALRQAISLQDTLLAENEKVRESLRGSEAEVQRLRAERDGLRAGWESDVARLREVKAELVTSREVLQAACVLTGYPDLAVQQGVVRLKEEIGRLALGAVRLGNEVTELRAEAHAMRTEAEPVAPTAPAAAEAEEPLRYTDDVPPSCDHCSKPAVWTCNHRAHCDDHRTGCTCWKYADRHASLERRLERRDDTIVRCEIRIEAARLKRDELLGAREKLQAEVKAQITELKAERDAARVEALRMRKAVLDERTTLTKAFTDLRDKYIALTERFEMRPAPSRACTHCGLSPEDAAGGACDALAGPEHDFQARNLDEENAKLRGKLEELRGQFSELIDERNQLNQRVHEKDEHRKAALGDSQNLQARLKEVTRQFLDRDTAWRAALKDVDRLGNEVTELRAEAHAMRTEAEPVAPAAPAAAEAEEPLRYTDDVPPSCDHCSKPAVWTCNHRAHCGDHRTGCTCWRYGDRHASLERRLERRDDTILRCETRIEAARLKRDELLGAREKLQAEVKAAQAQITELKAENANLHAQHEEDMKEVTRQFIDRDTAWRAALKDVEQYKAENKRLAGDLTRAQHEVADADVERYVAIGAAREKERKKHIEAFETFHAKYMELERENEAIGAELREAQKQIDGLSRVTFATPCAYEAVRDRTKLVRDWAWNSKGRKVRLPVEVTKELCEFLDGLPLVGSPAAPASAPAATPLNAHDTALVEGLLRTLKGEQVMTLAAMLPEDLMGLLITRAEALFAKNDESAVQPEAPPAPTVRAALDASIAQNEKLSLECDALSAECKELHGRISDGDDREDQLASEKESLRIQLEESKRETAQWLQRVDQIRAEEKIIGGQLVEVTKERDALATARKALVEERDALKAECDRLGAEGLVFRDQLTDADRAHAHLTAEVDRLQAECNQTRAEYARLRVESDGLRAQVEVLKSAISWKDDQWRRTGEEKGETAVERMRDAQEIRGLHATIRALREDNKRLANEREEQTVVHLEAARKAACDASGYPDEEILVAIHRLKGQAANLHDARNAMGAALVAVEKELGDAVDRTGPNGHKPEVFLVEAIRGVKGARDAALRDFLAANAEARKLRVDYTDLRARVDGVIASVYAKTGAPSAAQSTAPRAPVQTVRCQCTANDRPPNASCVFCKGKGVVALTKVQS